MKDVSTKRTKLALVVGKKRPAKKEGQKSREKQRGGSEERRREGGREGGCDRARERGRRGTCLPCGTITFLRNLPFVPKNARSLLCRVRVAQRRLHTT